MTQREAFFYFFQNKDIHNLELILTDDIFYSGISRDLFIQKLKRVFEQNTKLGKEMDYTIANRNPNFFYFSEGTENSRMMILDNLGKIIGFYYDGLNDNNKAIFSNYADEELGFVKTIDFILLQIECKQACEQYESMEYITKPFVFRWIKSYALIYEDCIKKYNLEEKLYCYLSDFKSYYDMVEYFAGLISLHGKVEEALECFNKRVSDDEWLEEYFELRTEISPCINFCSCFTKSKSIIKYFNHSIKIREIDTVYKFLITYDTIYGCDC